MLKKAEALQQLLDRYGYGEAENILDEWNYVKGWTEEFGYSVRAIHGLKNTSFMLACMAAAQNSPIDMLMYYDTRPSAFNGIFDFYTYEPLKGYYALYWYGKFYDMQQQIPAENSLPDIYALCGTGTDGKLLAMVTHYTDDDQAPSREITLDLLGLAAGLGLAIGTIFALDKTNWPKPLVYVMMIAALTWLGFVICRRIRKEDTKAC